MVQQPTQYHDPKSLISQSSPSLADHASYAEHHLQTDSFSSIQYQWVESLAEDNTAPPSIWDVFFWG